MQEKKFSFTPFLIILFFFMALFAFNKLVGPFPFSVNSLVSNEVDSFWVSGEGEIAVKPDTAYLSVGFRESGVTVDQVQTQMNQVMNNVVQRMKELGINIDRDIKTASYNISPIIDWRDQNQRITGYEASTTVKITIRDLDKVNSAVDEAVAGGANVMNSLTFGVDDQEKYIDEARQKAVAQAKERAQKAAKTAGFRLGRLISYFETFEDDYARPVYSEKAFSALLDSSEPATEIHTGTSEIKITVTITYAIE